MEVGLITMYLVVLTSSVSKDKVTQQLFWHRLVSCCNAATYNILAAGIPVMMISGGSWGAIKTAEVLSLSDDLPLLYPISIPDLPEGRSFHTMNNNIICGGKHSTTCIKLTRDWGASFTWFYSFSIILFYILLLLYI